MIFKLLNVMAQKYAKILKPEQETHTVCFSLWYLYMCVHIYTHIQYVQFIVLYKFIVCLVFLALPYRREPSLQTDSAGGRGRAWGAGDLHSRKLALSMHSLTVHMALPRQ